jgi:hypothetical protein
MTFLQVLTARVTFARRGVIAAVIVTATTTLVPAAGPASAQDAPRGAALLAEARSVVGGDQRLTGVRTLQVTGTFRRVVGDNDTEGDFEVFVELPDKYLRSEKTGTPGQPSIEVIEALVGNEVRDDVRGGGGGGRGGGGLNFGDDGFAPTEIGGDLDAGNGDGGAARGAAGVSGAWQPVEAGGATGGPVAVGRGGRGAALDTERQAREADVSRLLLMWLLESDRPLAWIGIAESPDRKADVLQTRFADGQPTRLFIDSSTHMPLMMQWDGAPAPASGRGRRGGGRRGGGGGGRRGGNPGDGPADGAGARQGGPPPAVTFDMTFFDHRAVDGILLPYVITRGANGQTTERWTISRYRVNPSLSEETFAR